MEPKWWRPGPGANSEYTGHDMDGELFNPPDEKIFKPFYMKSVGKASTQQLFDVDGPSPRDPPRSSWARAGKGTTSWMLKHEGPLLASSQEKHESPHPLKDVTAMQVQHAQAVRRALYQRRMHKVLSKKELLKVHKSIPAAHQHAKKQVTQNHKEHVKQAVQAKEEHADKSGKH
mmetsp:Transcript_8188/g.27503  ORF Transcript_8188/g.27503 Transcript_8188/m.27503 type:complete len:174 (-) Transcript_8188:43-564(-)